MNKTIFSVLLNGLLLSYTASVWAIDLTVNIEGIKSAQGFVMVALYDNAQDFPGKKRVAGLKLTAEKGTVQGQFTDLAAGQYAIACYHDANGNGRLDKNVLGMPKESYGFSNNAKSSFGPPKFKDAAFEVKDNTTISIALR